jgi:glutamyl-tRNA reductase
MTVAVVGISFHTAPVALREQASVAAGDTAAALGRIHALFPKSEFVLLSTCNRTELYTGGLDVRGETNRLLRLLLKEDARLHPDDLDRHVYTRRGAEAAEHLLAVASGLDSMVVGETEILGQVKQALRLAQAAGTTDGLLLPLFRSAVRTARRVHAETEIGRGRVSISSLAVAFAEKAFKDLPSRTIMLVGAGETAELALKSLMDRGARSILVINRSLKKAQDLASRCGGTAVPFDRLDAHLPLADIVISSTGAPHVVIKAAAIEQAAALRHGRPMLLIDIAVPRDIDPAASHVKGVHLHSIDDLQDIASRNLAKRRLEVDKAWAIIRQDAAKWAAS